MPLMQPNNQKLMLRDYSACNVVEEDSKFEDEKTKQTKDAKQ